MTIFHSTLLKRYVLLTAVTAFLIMAVVRMVYPALNVLELAWHAKLRSMTGQSSTYYSTLALFFLTTMYQLLYFFIGGVLGYVAFRIKHRNHGFSVLISRRFIQIFCGFFIVLSVFFLKVDIMNKYQYTFTVPRIAVGIPQGLKDKISAFFLPPIANPGKPQESYPAAQTTNQRPVSQSQPVIKTPGQSQPVFQPPVQTAPAVPVQTKKGATPQEIHAALNAYRQRNGLNTVAWDNGLAVLAARRTAYFNQIGRTDGGASFGNAVGLGGAKAYGFLTIGEVTAYGVTYMTATELIDGYFAKYPATNVQLVHLYSTHVGISVDGNAVAIVFAGNKT